MLSVQTNILAWNAGRQLKINTKKNAKSAEKLSSGYRINRAADDAAGLSISEKMRRQIRGLMQGSDNIQEGISLVQVADGALDEVVDILQRINELSVKAYNGTNTKEDRKYIQAEVTQLVKEIERIADTTTFNEIKVLKGNPTETVKIEANKVYTGTLTENVIKEIPKWLKAGIDENLELHGYAGYTQETDGEMFIVDQVDADGNIVGAISVPCGTCDRVFYGIGFGGTMEDGYSIWPQTVTNSTGASVRINATLDVTSLTAFTNDAGEAVNCFKKIEELISKQAKDKTLTEDIKEQQVKNLSEEIAKVLCEEVFKKMVGTTENADHFDRALKSGDYDIIVYDYRDQDKLTSTTASESQVLTSCNGIVEIPYNYFTPGMEVEQEHPLWIVCSSQFGDFIPVELPLLTAETLGITGYDVSRYTETVTEEYSDAYKAKLEAWENAFHYETVTITTPPTPDRTEKRPTVISSTPIYVNGEFVRMQQEYGIEEVFIPGSPGETKTIPIMVYDYPKPEPEEGDIIRTRTVEYDPDSNRKIGDALAYVLNCRTMLGAQQNRLEHAYNNNENKNENMTASESRIRDTDIAEEMVYYSNHNILLQAGASMLSQANQNAQFILQLLR